MRLTGVAAIAVFVVAACAEHDGVLVTVPGSASPEVRRLVEHAWPKVVSSCPGFIRYAADLRFDGVEENLSYAPEDARRVDVKIKVADEAVAVPAEFAAAGHTCYFSLMADGKTLSVSKRGCVAVCKGEYLDSPSEFSEKLP